MKKSLIALVVAGLLAMTVASVSPSDARAAKGVSYQSASMIRDGLSIFTGGAPLIRHTWRPVLQGWTKPPGGIPGGLVNITFSKTCIGTIGFTAFVDKGVKQLLKSHRKAAAKFATQNSFGPVTRLTRGKLAGLTKKRIKVRYRAKSSSRQARIKTRNRAHRASTYFLGRTDLPTTLMVITIPFPDAGRRTGDVWYPSGPLARAFSKARWQYVHSIVLGAATERKDNIPFPCGTPEYDSEVEFRRQVCQQDAKNLHDVIVAAISRAKIKIDARPAGL